MNKEIADRWTAALRSGEYPQGIGLLSRNGEFCCLGVLCEIAVEDGVITKDDSGVAVYYGTEDEGNVYVLSRSVLEWAGMWSEDGMLRDADTSLAALNDAEAWTFDRIAEYIDKHVDKL